MSSTFNSSSITVTFRFATLFGTQKVKKGEAIPVTGREGP
jgi:hypothetical protein